ncbi:uncharacterized protein RCC_09023 [Ramularia collo-cygni]|uniref:Uncharacterized protein n=1 Tax=Ramularia collo-cygni TaxID=112498 RepID=A0A2D3VE03_9PEZI|nr:uncharacterized protein RCC_09023 [Ramularia collo-cygni]CZT23312.1 uncharacterized protein RCC_09023 [Ramularia collo-cygni]
MPFDRESGQIYDETVAFLPKQDEDDLVYVEEPYHVRQRPKSTISIKGTRTLHKMAMLEILRSLDLLYSDLLEAFPLPILEQVWKAIKLESLDGLRMWKLFAPILASAGHHQRMTRTVDKRPQSTFAHVVKQITSPQCSWLTELTLDAIPLTLAAYVQVSKIQNLTSLAVIAKPRQDTGFSDRVLRAWSADAQAGSFCKLRFMFVGDHRFVTEQSLQYLSGFRVLELFCALNCRIATSSASNAKGSTPCKLTEEWKDAADGPFRSFLKSYCGIARAELDASLPGFRAYTAQRRRNEESRPHLLMTLLPELGQKNLTLACGHRLHCFERTKLNSGSQAVVGKDTASRHKRRKLKDTKSGVFEQMLQGLS